jgi:ribosomal RNA-processing protein 9
MDDETFHRDEKRIRLAAEYLETLNNIVREDEKLDEELDERDKIHDLLDEERKKNKQGFRYDINAHLAQRISQHGIDLKSISSFPRLHKNVVTCVSLTSDDSSLYSCSRDGSLIHWDVETRKKKSKIAKDTNQLLSVSVSDDGKFVATGGKDSLIRIYDGQTLSHIDSLKGHRAAVTVHFSLH